MRHNDTATRNKTFFFALLLTLFLASTSVLSATEIRSGGLRTLPIELDPDGLRTLPIELDPDGLRTLPIELDPDGLR